MQPQNPDDNKMKMVLNRMSDEMEAADLMEDADDDFANLMIIHHQGAIDMGMKQIAYGNEGGLKIMAKIMIDLQQLEMDKLDYFLVKHTPISSTKGQQWNIETEASRKRMNNDVNLQILLGDADNDFAVLMIQHQRNANDMAQSLLQYGHHEELKALAIKMIEDQNTRIETLQNWLIQNKPQ